MRLIGSFETEKEAYAFYSFLLKEGIQNIYEPFSDEKTGQKSCRIWIYDENDLDLASEWLTKFKEHPEDPHFKNIDIPLASTPPPPNFKEEAIPPDPDFVVRRRRFPLLLTPLIIIVCGILFLWVDFEEGTMKQEYGPIATQIAMTPLEQKLMFDLPSGYQDVQELLDTVPLKDVSKLSEIPPVGQRLIQQANDAPSWGGLYAFVLNKQSGPMFEKIRQGEIWRLFTPCLLHAAFLHILFNMAWVWVLCQQMELRLSKLKICLLILIIAVISNTAQYIMSGPFFLGFSGVVVGMTGFIWMRQKVAPWEGYPLAKGMVVFLFLFVVAMLVLEVITFSLRLFSIIEISPPVANTAHIIGGLVGMALGRLSFFARKMS